jgi:hypothetical protein
MSAEKQSPDERKAPCLKMVDYTSESEDDVSITCGCHLNNDNDRHFNNDTDNNTNEEEKLLEDSSDNSYIAYILAPIVAVLGFLACHFIPCLPASVLGVKLVGGSKIAVLAAKAKGAIAARGPGDGGPCCCCGYIYIPCCEACCPSCCHCWHSLPASVNAIKMFFTSYT